MTSETPAQTLTPVNNPDLVGQERAERVLLEAWNSGRLPHAWLLYGPRGIGKATLAYRFARFVLAGGGEEGGGLFGDAPEGLYLAQNDPVFQRIAAGGHGGLRVLQPGEDSRGRRRKEIVIDEVRGLTNFLRMTAAEDGWRVLIVDAAEDLNRNAANALLKNLEEPSEKSLMLLISHAPGRLLPTIRSRCCQLAMPALSDDVVAQLLQVHAPGLGEDAIASLVRLAEGSIGQALSLEAAGGLALHEDATALFASLPRVDLSRALNFADKASSGSPETFDSACRIFLRWIYLIARARGGASDGRRISPEEREIVDRLAPQAQPETLLGVWERWERTFPRADTTGLNRRQMLLSAFHDVAGALA